MAIATATILASLAAAQGVMSITQGMAQQNAYKQQANNATATANLQAKEQVRQSFKEAEVEKANAKDFERRQKLSYLASGVTLEGSPLLIMEETRRKGAENVDEILRSGTAAYGATIQEGRNAASTLKAQGRQAFTSGLTNAIGSGIDGFKALK